MSSRQIFVIILCLLSHLIVAQQDYFIVDQVIYEGNKRTAQRVIDNELDVLPGDTVYVNQLIFRLLENEKRLLSTGLFTIVDIEVKNWRLGQHKADIVLSLQENWYIYPSLVFDLADRNFNVWWKEMNRDFGRVNYGLSLDHINLTGHRDKLRIKLQQGYIPKYEANYRYPYLNRYWGINGEIFYSTNKEIGYITQGNKTLFRRAGDERILLTRFRTSIGLNYRPNVYLFNEARLQYHQNTIDELVATDFNPDYFLDGQTRLRFFLFNYNIRYDKRLFTLYPEGGYAITANVKKEGLGIFGDFNNLSVDLAIEKHKRLSDRWIWGVRIKGKTNLIRSQIAFANNTGLGYKDDLVRGYELYVVDGTDWVLAKTNLRWNIYNKLQNLKRWMPLKQLKRMPLSIYLRFNLESGYVNERTYTNTNLLNNRMLLGYGPALDIILWNTALFSTEYSFNHLGEHNLFLQTTFNF